MQCDSANYVLPDWMRDIKARIDQRARELGPYRISRIDPETKTVYFDGHPTESQIKELADLIAQEPQPPADERPFSVLFDDTLSFADILAGEPFKWTR